MKGSVKLKVDEDDLISDVIHFYKDPSFDPTKRLRVSLNGQVAIDTGGILRQVFTDVFSQLSENGGGLTLFKGKPQRKVPVFSNMHVLTGIYEVIGKMIAHSLVQNGPGFPYLAPVIYWYIASGDIHSAVLKSSCMDVGDQQPLASYIDKIRVANREDLNGLNSDEEFIHLMSECGETRLLTETNKLDVAQSLITFYVLTRNIAMLDQMRKGLSLLGLLEEIEKYPNLFEHLFVHQGNRLTPAYVKDLLKVDECDTDVSTVEVAAMCTQFLLSFIESCDEQELSDFLHFVTGTGHETSSLVPRSVKVYFTDTDTIYSSTCLMEIKIPKCFKTQEQFDMAIRAVTKGHSFNSH